MSEDKVRVRHRGTAVCPDFDALDRDPPLRRPIGRRYTEISPGQFAWVPTNVVEEVSKRSEIARAIVDGDLFAGDEATAKWAHSVTRSKVVFDPTFGGAVAAKKAPEVGQATSSIETTTSSSVGTPSDDDDDDAETTHHEADEAGKVGS